MRRQSPSAAASPSPSSSSGFLSRARPAIMALWCSQQRWLVSMDCPGAVAGSSAGSAGRCFFRSFFRFFWTKMKDSRLEDTRVGSRGHQQHCHWPGQTPEPTGKYAEILQTGKHYLTWNWPWWENLYHRNWQCYNQDSFPPTKGCLLEHFIYTSGCQGVRRALELQKQKKHSPKLFLEKRYKAINYFPYANYCSTMSSLL